ncbi:hypothetical protein WJX81_006104 [Elliptochloris bilobata]|uniref:LYR motif-containing protein 2 n=1 Tax=Elliptochloris bilobata TaxID=381761 RepID=A0AAW1S895_9CHLO
MAELSVFILKSQSLHLYRSFLRTLREAPKDVQSELHEQIRAAFERARSQREPYAIKYTLSDGRTQLKQLNNMLALRR